MAGNFLSILFVSAEASPFAKVGGLADVAGSLPNALARLGHQVTLVMPAYRMILEDPRWSFEVIAKDIPVEIGPDWSVPATVYTGRLGEVEVRLIGGGGFFEDTVSSETIYQPGVDKYLFFSHAVLTCAKQMSAKFDIVHVNDWQTALIPVLMTEKYSKAWSASASVFTIHNLAYQGEFDADLLDRMGLPQSLFNSEQLETWGRLNFLKAGCVYADRVNTVSPHYATEIQTAEFGCTLEGLMLYLAKDEKLSGILNGIDYEAFDPEHDPALPANYSAEDSSGKITCKARLQSELGLPVKPGTPLLGIVSRLSSQKGLDLVIQIAPKLSEIPAQLVVQGLGDPWIAGELKRLESEHPETIRFIDRFDAELAQRVYAGSDFFLMPSSFEPCGLGQMIAMRYGTIPIARRTGGLADTIQDHINGFLFKHRDAGELWAAIDRAVEEYRMPSNWSGMVLEAMGTDFTWTKSAEEYAALYRRALSDSQESVSAAAS